MEKTAIGFKIEVKMSSIVLLIVSGIIMIGAGIAIFIFAIGGALGGAILGALAGGGAGLIAYAHGSKTLPNKLVYIDDNTVYFQKCSFSLSSIKNVSAKGRILTVTFVQGKPIGQGLLNNAEECAARIMEKLPKQA
jgi:hypothetical protein